MTRDCKNIHEELLIRHEYDWRNGWKPGQLWVSGFLWGIALVVWVLAFWS